MNFQFFLPDILNLLTGGNIFNQHLMQELARHHEVNKKVISASAADENNGLAHSPEDAYWILDSLLMRNNRFMERVAGFKKSKSKLLLVHYLNILNPENSSGPDAVQERENLSIFDGFITTSQYSKQKLVEAGISPQQIAAIQPGITERYLGESKNRLIIQILTVSSIFPGKGLQELLPVLEKLSNLPWQWILVGEQNLDREFSLEFKRQVEHFRLKDRIHILGPMSQISLFQIYKQSDIFVLNSHFESCSMVTMEAMSFGLPVLVNRVGGLPELVENGKNGFLVSPGDIQLFTESLRKLISDAHLRVSMGKKAYQRSHSFPSWKESMEKFLNFIPSYDKSPGC